MLPAYVGIDRFTLKGKRIVSVDAGGTNLRVALVIFDKNGNAEIDRIAKHRMPGAGTQISRGDFFRRLAEYIVPLLTGTDTVAISFAYPVQIMPDMDGRVVRMTKEVRIDGIEGCMIGDCLKGALAVRGVKDCNVYVLNDTVATCMAGIAVRRERTFGSFCGLVLGTGINTCYIEEVKNIKKLTSGFDKRQMMVNVESGGYGGQPRGDIDILFDETTNNPGQHTIEKMVSGAYLGALIDRTIRESEAEGLFSDSFYTAFRSMDELDLIEVNTFIADHEKDHRLSKACQTAEDADKLDGLIEAMIGRAAKLAALQAGGAAAKSGKGTRPDQPVCITAEGSTYYKLKGMRQAVEFHLKNWLENEQGVYTQVIQVDDAVLKGAAVAGLLK